MKNTIMLIALIFVVIAIVIVVILLVTNTKKTTIDRELEEINIRYNAIKTIPLAFKFNKAQAMAKRSEATAEKIKSYYERYNNVQKHIDNLEEMIVNIEENLQSKEYDQAYSNIEEVNKDLEELEVEVNNIDKFLDVFSEKEDTQRDISVNLKEEYRNLKTNINKNSNKMSIAYEELEKKLENCEEMFSLSEELMYSNDYSRAGEILKELGKNINNIKKIYKNIPDLIKDAKGVIPNLIDEVNRKYDLARQRGVYLEHLNIEQNLINIKVKLNNNIKMIINCEIDNVKKSLDEIKKDLNNLISNLEKENKDYGDSKEIYDKVIENLVTIKELYNYVNDIYTNDYSRFQIEETADFLEDTKNFIDSYTTDSISLSADINDNNKASSIIKKDLDKLFDNTEITKKRLTDYKNLIVKNINDEERGRTQVIKFEVVLNEIEVKVIEYHLPSIASKYKDDLASCRERITNIKEILNETPIDIDKLNSTLDEAMNYIYSFYNNVNNVVGMAIMVENAIVFGNKFRSSYNIIDRDLSKAEFSYLNGEYTKALKLAFSGLETVFPKKNNDKNLENG